MKRFSDYTVLAEQRLRGLNFPESRVAGLYSPIVYALSGGGKRLRPALMLMACEAFGGDASQALDAAAGIEMFHNFTLLHDDVMDCSDTRRGRPSVQAKFGVNSAILSGDTMLTLATQAMMNVPDQALRRVLDIFNAMAIRVYEGQQIDMEFENDDNVTLDDYLRMISDKTGALIGAAAQIGAIIGGASERDASLLYQYGMMLGLAFQIQDDWLDVFGDATTFGKPIGGDINNNKKSYLLLSALSKNTPDSEALRETMKMAPGATKVKAATRIYEKMGISEEVRNDVMFYTSKAMAALRSTSLSDEAREPFRLLADKLSGRKK